MRFDTLDAWLAWQETLNPAEVELGLDRIREVNTALGYTTHFDCPLITVAGTNGKGSVVAMLESMASTCGLRVGAYTSPHLIRYNERIRFAGEEVSDERLCRAFAHVDEARKDVQLTYFEFGTLAAIDLFRQEQLDLIIMEIGLGGRLDAVNIMDPDVAVITAVDIDHTDWLGEDREQIGAEKAGIMRERIPVICGDRTPPESIEVRARELEADTRYIGIDFDPVLTGGCWSFTAGDDRLDDLALPALAGDFQIDNAATAICAFRATGIPAADDSEAISGGLSKVSLPGRYQCLQSQPAVFVDVAHNPQAAASLATNLRADASAYSQTIAVVAMLKDKDAESVIRALSNDIDRWYPAGLEGVSRGADADSMKSVLERQVPGDRIVGDTGSVRGMIDAAISSVAATDRIIIFGSFYTVAIALEYFDSHPCPD